MTFSNVVRASCILRDGAQERPPGSGGSVEWGWTEDNLLEDARQLIHVLLRSGVVVDHLPLSRGDDMIKWMISF